MTTRAPFATFTRRAAALLIDGPIAFVIAVVMSTILMLPWTVPAALAGNPVDFHEESLARLSIQALTVIGVFLYFTVLESSRWQGTPGKRLMGLRVTTLDGGRVGFGRSCARNLLKGLSSNAVFSGYFRFFLSECGQTFHDSEAGTFVVHQPSARGTSTI